MQMLRNAAHMLAEYFCTVQYSPEVVFDDEVETVLVKCVILCTEK